MPAELIKNLTDAAQKLGFANVAILVFLFLLLRYVVQLHRQLVASKEAQIKSLLEENERYRVRFMEINGILPAPKEETPASKSKELPRKTEGSKKQSSKKLPPAGEKNE